MTRKFASYAEMRRVTMAEKLKAAEASGKHFDATEPRSLSMIAAEVTADWKNVYFGAVPYLNAMAALERITDDYGAETAESVVMYFLANAHTWRGLVARRVKAELNAMLKSVRPKTGIRS